jgi:hypothetical protein
MFYHRGRRWYARQFPNGNESYLYDPTPSYIRSPMAPKRISEENPDAKILVCLRDPVDRAFSHYWHERSKGKIEFAFEEVLENYDLYQNWVEPGLYGHHLQRWWDYFGEEQFLIQTFESLSDGPKEFYGQILDFLGIGDHTPSVLQEKVNTAGWLRGPLRRVGRKAFDRVVGADGGPHLLRSLWERLTGKSRYSQGPPADIEAELRKVITPDVEELEQLLDRPFTEWKV